jgi:predicted secreted protein
MHVISNQLIFFVVLTVLLFILVGIVMLVLIDHKAKIPGEFQDNPFGISGMRRQHPVISFITTFILGVIIIGLIFELTVVMGEHLGLFNKEIEKPEILKKIKYQRYSESQRHFHNIPKENKVNMGKKPVCFECHGDYPHSKKRMVRTLLNMHTQFVGCMTCHTDPRKRPEENYTFRWLNYSGIEVQGPPFGTDINPKTGYLIDTDDLYSKIVVFSQHEGEETLLEITEENSDARDFLLHKDKLSDEDKQAIKKSFHTLVMPKGRFCTRCHTAEEKSYIPFRQLGFSEQRIENVTNLNIVGIVEKYREFYMPNLFNEQTSSPDVKALLGEGEAASAPGDELLKGRAWWRRSGKTEIDK